MSRQAALSACHARRLAAINRPQSGVYSSALFRLVVRHMCGADLFFEKSEEFERVPEVLTKLRNAIRKNRKRAAIRRAGAAANEGRVQAAPGESFRWLNWPSSR